MNMLSLSTSRSLTSDQAAALRAADPVTLQLMVPSDVRVSLAGELPIRVTVERIAGQDVATYAVAVESLDCTRSG